MSLHFFGNGNEVSANSFDVFFKDAVLLFSGEAAFVELRLQAFLRNHVRIAFRVHLPEFYAVCRNEFRKRHALILQNEPQNFQRYAGVLVRAVRIARYFKIFGNGFEAATVFGSVQKLNYLSYVQKLIGNGRQAVFDASVVQKLHVVFYGKTYCDVRLVKKSLNYRIYPRKFRPTAKNLFAVSQGYTLGLTLFRIRAKPEMRGFRVAQQILLLIDIQKFVGRNVAETAQTGVVVAAGAAFYVER